MNTRLFRSKKTNAYIIIGVLVIIAFFTIYIKNFGVVGRVIGVDKNDHNIYVQLEYSEQLLDSKSAYIQYGRCENYKKDDKIFAICNTNIKNSEPAYVSAIIVIKIPW